MTIPVAGSVAVFGLLIGSFLNVVIHRVPAGESIVSPGSRCPRCGVGLRARDNVPVVSWLLLRRRCRSCAEPISARYPAVELLTALVFGLTTARFGRDPVLSAFLLLGGALIALAAIDLELRILPKRIVWPVFGSGLVLLSVAAFVDQELGNVLTALGGAAAAFAVFFVIHFISPRGMGFGDVRLAALIGLFLGWLGWGHVALGLFGGFLLGSIAGVAALMAGRSRKSALPFGPFMAAGALLTVWLGDPVLHWYLGAF